MPASRHLRLRLLVVALYALTLAFVGLMQPVGAGNDRAFLASLAGGVDIAICSHDDAGAPNAPVGSTHECHDLCLVCCVAGLPGVAGLALPPPDGVPVFGQVQPVLAAVDLWRARTNARGPPLDVGLA